ncbi:MAG: DUF302 domain-containing protein [Candidatus Woesearchaeota archaeon]
MYSYGKPAKGNFAETLAKVKVELEKEGFSVISEIDVKAILKKKIDLEYGNYTIIGACNPKLSHQALEKEKEAGLFLPCNIIVFEDKGVCWATAILPTQVMGTLAPKVEQIAEEAEKKLKHVINAVSEEKETAYSGAS